MKNGTLSGPQWLVLSFLSVIVLGSILLQTPWAIQSGSGSYIDSLFVATSAVCVTGLVTVDTGTHWTVFGQLVIMLLIQIGGLGVMSFATFFALIVGKKIQLRQRLVMQQSINISAVGGVVRVFKHLLLFTFLIEALGAIMLIIRWIPTLGLKKAIYFGIFHSISAFNNAGFDLFGGFKSLTEYSSDITVNLVISTLIISGGLGFYVWYEIFNYRKSRSFSLHSKVVLITTAILLLTGTGFLFFGEYNHALKGMSPGVKLLASYFQSVSPRTAGFNTIDLNSLFLSSQLLIIILMLIGASPGSTGGGIKTSTLAILWVAIISQLKGKKDSELFERRIEDKDVLQALTLAALFTATFIIMTFLVSLSYRGELSKIAFEVASALGTVGLSLGLTPELNTTAKVLIIITMFLGRVGPLTLGFALAYQAKQPEIRYPKGKIMIG
ncbi:MAG: TrkH family potassium uptake protein [Syntrophomonadaceae bacterium]|nr:TrkH family potassium uptake protein [Syntrophomonadaceae bacterium]